MLALCFRRHTMSRWIDYDAIDYRNDRLHDKSEEFLNGVIYMAQRIEDAPSIDIVRCAECRCRNENCGMGEHKWCEKLNMSTTPDDFCNYGERRE